MTPALEKEGPVASTSSKPAPEVSKDKLKGPQKKQKDPKNHQGKGKGKANWHRTYPQSYRIPKLEPSAMHSLFNRAQTLIFEIKKAFKSSIFNSEKDKALSWLLKQKDRLSALHSDMSDSMINIQILRKCGGELEHAIKCRCVEPCSTADYINSMEDIITKPNIGKTWTRVPMESKMVSKASREDKRRERPVLKCHKCGSSSHLANTCTKKEKINEVQLIKEVQRTEEKEESDLDSAVSEDTPVDDYPIENITAFFQVTELHTHLPQYSEDFNSLINIQAARMCKPKPARAILPEWKKHLLPIDGVQFISASNNMYPLGILDTNLVFPHPAGGVRMKKERVPTENCTSQHIIFGNVYLNIYGIDINNHKDRYFTIGENTRQKISFFNVPKQISILYSLKDTHKEEFVANQLVEAQIIPSLSPKMRHDLIYVLYTYKNTFASDNELLGTIKGHEVDITLNIDRPNPPVLRRPAYPASPRAREALEKHIQELIQFGVLRKLGHNEDVEVAKAFIVAWNNDKSRMVGDFRALNVLHSSR
ncbi:hypothetical protein O181_043717 [Austropuccinia psidii MF-1]|uniref:CCHC-type domain-containing protein n=1 Tax=Austropuccinia psidii MF-1 TaxID=1389203 RepID=A0A9Q3DQD7_9BASI|nr:hypothetical protein [Austropuccinia psidii MF-1]